MTANEPEPSNTPQQEPQSPSTPGVPSVPHQQPGQQFEERRGVNPDQYERKERG
jgi:hypothetical protein